MEQAGKYRSPELSTSRIGFESVVLSCIDDPDARQLKMALNGAEISN